MSAHLPEVPAQGSRSLRVGRNTAFRVSAQSISAAINVAGMMLLARHLSAGGYGQYVAWYAMAPLLASVADLGLGVHVTRTIAREPQAAARVLGDALLVRLVVAVSVLAVMAAVAWPLLGAEQTLLLVVVAAAALLDFGADPAVWVSRAHERLEVESALLLVSQCVWLGGIAIAVAANAPLPVMLGVAVVAFAVRTLVGAAWLARRVGGLEFAPDRTRLVAQLREGVPAALSLLLVVGYSRAGVFALQWLSSSIEVACFNVAWMLAQPLGFLASSLAVALFPSIARLGGDREAFATALRPAYRYQWALSLPLAVGLSLVAPAVIPMFFAEHSGFAHAADALRVVAFALPFVFLNLQSRYLLAASGHAGVYLRAVALGLAIEVIGCAWLVREHGALGAAWTFVAAEVAVAVICQRELVLRAGWAGLFAEALRPAIASVGMAAVVLLLSGAPIAVVVAAAAASYAVILVCIGGLGAPGSVLVRGLSASGSRSVPATPTGRPS